MNLNLPPTRHLLVSLPLLFSPACGDAGHGHDHGPNGHEHAGEGEDAHEHGEEVSLGTAAVGDLTCEFAQGHGAVVAGGEGHLVVKIKGGDGGKSTVRAWIGTKDRGASLVGLGEYAASHDDYDIHAEAPDPLPADVMWWVEVEKPDGSKVVGSVKPLLE
ncbi:MAG: hypothetical protein O2816_02900 [Planctomycetota bacterium]|nr:hypothetical protein [Planctomycetota bacterium]